MNSNEKNNGGTNKKENNPHNNKKNKDFYDNISAEIIRRRKRSKSIWTDKPVIPVRKSIWLDEVELEDDIKNIDSNVLDEPALPDENNDLIKTEAEVENQDELTQAPFKKTLEYKVVKRDNKDKLVLISEIDEKPKELDKSKKTIQFEDSESIKRVEIVLSKPLAASSNVKEVEKKFDKKKRAKKSSSKISKVLICLLIVILVVAVVLIVPKILRTDDNRKNISTQTKAPEESVEPESQSDVGNSVADSGVFNNENSAKVVVTGEGEEIRAVSGFYGTKEKGEKIASSLNEYKKKLGKNINIYNMSIPLSSAFYLPKTVESVFTNQADYIKTISDNLVDVENCDVYSVLENYQNDDIYLKTENSVQGLGAFYCSQVFALKANVNFPGLTSYEKCEQNGYVGSFYELSDGEEDLKNHPDNIVYYKPSDKYSVDYLDENFENETAGEMFGSSLTTSKLDSFVFDVSKPVVKINTDNDTNRVLVLVADSNGKMLAPFFIGSFSKIYVIDINSFDIDKIQEVNDIVQITDILFAYKI